LWARARPNFSRHLKKLVPVPVLSSQVVQELLHERLDGALTPGGNNLEAVNCLWGEIPNEYLTHTLSF